MNSILLNVFIELATKGFCIAPEFAEDLKDDVEGRPSGGVGLGEGKGEKDISDQIENEDQLEDAQPAGQEKQKQEDDDCKEEGKGIEMSEDFDSKLQDIEKPKDDEESQSESGDSDAEKQMGDTEKGSNKLDQQIWGSDDEADENEEDAADDKKEEQGSGGEKEGEPEMAAKEEESGANEEDEANDDKKEKRKEKQKDINEMDEPEFDDDQVDPYHGNQPELPEPEPMDLPDNLQLDDGEEKDQADEDNPFDIDAMKENMPPENAEVEDEEDGKDDNIEDPDKTADNGNEDSSDDETPLDEPMDDSVQQNDKQEPQEMSKDEEVDDKDQTKEDTDSGLDQKQSNEQQIQPMECDKEQSADNVQSLDDKNKNTSMPNDEVMDENNPDKDGVGQAQIEETSTGHKGQANAEQDSFNALQEDEKKDKDKRRPGQADSKRSLGDAQDSIKKKLKTVDVPEQEEPEDSGAEDADENNKDAEIFQHIKDAKKSDTQVLDVATQEQAETQQVSKDEKDNSEEVTEIEENVMDEPDIDPDLNVSEQKPEKAESTKNKKSEGKQSKGDIVEELKEVEIDGETVDTYSVPRGGDSSHHTQFDLLSTAQASALNTEEMHQMRMDLQKQLGTWNEPPPNIEAEKTWEKITSLTSSLAQDLSEQLRLVLEPTQASRLRGDFRTGRRINMRKVIPYIASQFRKDKIWLRRTKPSKREYQIVLAIDDSSSMADNHSKELAFESIALISKALSLLESGQLAVLSFGEGTEIVHKLNDTFTEKSGTKLLQKFQFQQKKTCVAKLVDFATEMLSNVHTNALNAKLLIVVSDGRGIFSEGETIVHQAVRRARFSDIFMIFVIIDNPENRDSILDIRIPVFNQGKLLGIKSYMDSFPFPFYIILREISTLPSVLSDALRQWFELISNVDKQ